MRDPKHSLIRAGSSLKLQDFLVFETHPCCVAIPARDVLRVTTTTDPTLHQFVDMGVCLGITPISGESASSDRALAPMLADDGWAILAPANMSLVTATPEQLLPLPQLLQIDDSVTAILEQAGDASALILSCEALLRRQRKLLKADSESDTTRVPEEGKS